MNRELFAKPAQFVVIAITLISLFVIFLIIVGEALGYLFPYGIGFLAFLVT